MYHSNSDQVSNRDTFLIFHRENNTLKFSEVIHLLLFFLHVTPFYIFFTDVPFVKPNGCIGLQTFGGV